MLYLRADNYYGTGRRRLSNARRPVFFCTSHMPGRTNIDYAAVKRIMKLRAKASRDRKSKKLGSSSKEEDAAPNDQVQSQILGSSSKEKDAAPNDQVQSQMLHLSLEEEEEEEEDAAPNDQVQSQIPHLSQQEEDVAFSWTKI
ncbi:uncharacterized protein LOC130499409 [Raphanus sativus]|uniref:Uncharacterized protein LOC130499409 n=1 Tax=Raphanus sativus TaxID=3726 RepID=A0A9W3CD31_RAPSA|nr:uncharacterized protein LOC130499409 [Raphanus sativus]